MKILKLFLFYIAIISFSLYARDFSTLEFASSKKIKFETPTIAMVGAATGGYLANVIAPEDGKISKIANGVTLTIFFGFQVICLIGILLDNSIYAHNKQRLFDDYDRALLFHLVTDSLIRGGCYFLGSEAAKSTRKALGFDKAPNPPDSSTSSTAEVQ